MKSKFLIILLVALTLAVSGCGKTNKDKATIGDVAKTYGAAQELSQDMDDFRKISSEENIENIYTIMNYVGNESKSNVKEAIRQGMEAGKNQRDLDKEIVVNPDLGTGYMLGYVFGCRAVTGDEDRCNEEMGNKYQAIMMEELQQQFQGAMPIID